MKVTPNTQVANEDNTLTGRTIGPFTRKGDRWWTIFWSDNTTTAIREKDMLGEQEA
jgi:hypothetical protein